MWSEPLVLIETIESKHSVLTRMDYIHAVHSDLPAAGALYHKICRNFFRSCNVLAKEWI